MAEEVGGCDKSYTTTICKVVDQALDEIMAIRREIRQMTEEDEEHAKSIIYGSIIDVVTNHMSNVKAEMLLVVFRYTLTILVT